MYAYQMLVEEPMPAKPIATSRALQQYLFHLLQNRKTLPKMVQIHAQIIINGFSQKKYILAKLLSLYMTSGHLVSADKVFENIKNPGVTVWIQMIKGHARSETPQKSVELFRQMLVTEAEPNGLTYSILLSGCARSGLLREGEQVHARVLANGYYSNVFVNTNLVNLYAMAGGDNGVLYAHRVFDDMYKRNIVSWNSMLAGYMRCGDVDGARRMFDMMLEKNVVSWTTMIAGYAQNGKSRQALVLFDEMKRVHVELDQVVLVAALTACAELGDLKMGRWIHSYIQQTFSVKGQTLLISLNNALVHMYSSCGMIEEAYEVFQWMPQRNTISWTSMITAFAKQGHGEAALKIFQLMQSLGTKDPKPDDITFIGVLFACSHVGLVDEARLFFQNMIEIWNIKPRIEHYGCMVDLLSRAGFLDEAWDLIKLMPMKPSNAIWGALLNGCKIYKHVELASNVAKKLVPELDSDEAAGYLVLLADVHAIANRWDNVAILRKKMVEIGARKPAGRSSVQVDGMVHDFVAADMTHKHASSIYDMLGRLTRHAKCQGYKPDKLQLLLDINK